MNEVLKQHLISGTQTFLATFLVVIGTTLQGEVQWTAAFWAAVLLTAARSALKEVFAKFAPMSFGGRQGATLLGVRK